MNYLVTVILTWTLLLKLKLTECLVVPPFWANPEKNPCAAQPHGWQLIHWPGDGKCYKIFEVGHPCPETMELTPVMAKEQVFPECKCPPNSALHQETKKCFPLFEQGPCLYGEYFTPSTDNHPNRTGFCKKLQNCTITSKFYWPRTEKCYPNLTRGPCPEGKLFIFNLTSGLPACSCDKTNVELKPFYWKYTDSCHEHYTRGPCPHRGHLFLPDGKCGCSSDLPQYHPDTRQCYKLGEIGPCASGHHFQINELGAQSGQTMAKCICKLGYIYWKHDKKCYRKYTQGPCKTGQFFVNPGLCVTNPCEVNSLYIPEVNKCYRIGSQGPCGPHQVVVFDFNARPSIDGISYNGLCGCSRKNSTCMNAQALTKKAIKCDHGKVVMNKMCHMLYTSGPCAVPGQWLVPKRMGRHSVDLLTNQASEDEGACECRPDHKHITKSTNGTLNTYCEPPSVGIASYLNEVTKMFRKKTVKLPATPPCLNAPEWNHGSVLIYENNNIHFVERGNRNKPLILFLHGFPEFWYTWRYQIREFSERYWCVAIDMRGYGESFKPRGKKNYGVDLLANDIKLIVEKLGRQKLILIAHDWGAAVAWKFMENNKSMVDKYVLINGLSMDMWKRTVKCSLTQMRKSWYILFFQMFAIPEKFLKFRNFKAFDEIFEESCSKDDIETFKYPFREKGNLTPPINYYRENLLAALKSNTKMEQRQVVQAKGLFIFGYPDPFYTDKAVENIHKSVENLEIILIENGGHFVQQKFPRAVNSCIWQFLVDIN